MTSSASHKASFALIRGPLRDPIPLLARLREDDPVHWVPGLDAWLVTRHEDVRQLFADGRLTTDARAYERYEPPTEPGADRWFSELSFRSTASDPDSLGRRLVSAALTPRSVARIEHRIQEVVDHFAEQLRERTGVVDLLGSFTSPVAATVMGRILGVPPKVGHEDAFQKLARRATRIVRPVLSRSKRRDTERAMVEMCDYVQSLAASRQRAPRPDLISDLLRASRGGASASVEDVVRVVAVLVAAGVGTTADGCARALRALLRHPEELASLREDPSLVPAAVDELLRYDGGVAFMPRYVLEGFDLRGRELRPGQLVVLSVIAANRDPRVFPEPDRLDFRRETRPALTFGLGPHYCIGANIARTELRLMLLAALEFLPERARLLEDEIVWTEKGLLSQIRTLPVDFGA
ncbi:MAG: cytochrome P450 [Myxococcota bacterium]|nr:cytochrome P450 [Myxococcota bacterium]